MALNRYQKITLLVIACVDVYLLVTVERACEITNVGAVLTSGMFIFLFHVLTILVVMFPDDVCSFVTRVATLKYQRHKTQWEGYLVIVIFVLASLHLNYYELRGTGVYGGVEQCSAQ